jgi:hypothetical protein
MFESEREGGRKVGVPRLRWLEDAENDFRAESEDMETKRKY